LRRYPVKSMLGENLRDCAVTGRGLTGDRLLGLVHRETGKVASHDAAAQAVRAVDNVETVLRAAGATLADVVAWTVLIAADADVAAAYGAIAPRLARAGAPPLVTAARVAGLAVPGALLEISAIAALTAN